MSESQKQTVDVVLLIAVLAKFIRRELAGDGLQITDLVKLATTPEFQERFIEAVSGIGEVPIEIGNLDKLEGIDLAIFALTAARDVLADEQQLAA
ncbi:MAG: hypothetical protein M3Q07_17755 [Pseudobdellovibrionaceae bacterium]|nr:hypothetical protein [Pseudobdellovibrionaceae bacterium]